MDAVVIPRERIESKIYLIRGKKVMLDRDLALLYGVETGTLNQFDFMFQLTGSESEDLISQIVISSLGHGGVRKLPFVFTEQGVAMLSSVLNSDRAVMVNIQIIRTFIKIREMIAENDYLRRKLEIMEKEYDENFKIVFDALRRLLDNKAEPAEEIGFRTS